MRYSLLPLLLLLLASCSRADRMRHMLEQAEWMNRHDSLFTSDSVGRALVRYYDHWWHPADLRLRAYYMLGCAYRDMGNAPRALENYQLAAQQVDTLHAPDSTLNRLMRVHSQMSRIYLLQRLPEEMLEETRTAAQLAWKIGDSQSALAFEHSICYNLYNNKEYAACIQHALALHRNFLQYGHKEDAQLAYIHCVKVYLALHDYVSAKKYLDEYEKCAYFQTNPEKVNGGVEALYRIKGEYYINIGQVDSAACYYQKAARNIRQGGNKLLLYNGLLRTYERMHQADSVLKYAHLYSEAKEKSFDEALTSATIQAKTLYDYTLEQQQAKVHADKVSQLSKLLVTAILLILTLVLLLLYYRRNKKRRITNLIQKYQATVQELHEAEEDLSEEKLMHKNDKKLIMLHENYINSLKMQVRSLKQSIQKIESRANRIRIEAADITKTLMKSRMIGKTMTKGEWIAFIKLFEEAHPMFYKQMNARQKLNENEYMVCVLTASGFNPTDIEVLMGKSNSFSAMTRKRLCVKVFGVEGTPQDFDRLLHQLF